MCLEETSLIRIHILQKTKHTRAVGAICALRSNIYSDSTYYKNNHANEYGGVIYADSCTHSNRVFQSNKDDELLLAGTMSICTENEFLNELRSGFDSVTLELPGVTIFTDNTCGFFGGAITSIQIGIVFNGTVPAVICYNEATYGGGLALIRTTLSIHSPIEIQDNRATLSGGGIFCYLSSSILSSQGSGTTNISDNIASQYGGGMYAIDSYIEISYGKLHFENNTAYKGAALSLKQNSKIHLLKERRKFICNYNMKLEFIDNRAQFGGAVYISDRSQNISACKRAEANLAQPSQECFIQTILLNSTTNLQENTLKTNYINVLFMNNTASVSGGAVYGGLLDRCMILPTAEIAIQFPELQQSTGFDYIRATAQFAGLVDYNNLTLNYNPYAIINAIKSPSVEGLISSEPVCKFAFARTIRITVVTIIQMCLPRKVSCFDYLLLLLTRLEIPSMQPLSAHFCLKMEALTLVKQDKKQPLIVQNWSTMCTQRVIQSHLK